MSLKIQVGQNQLMYQLIQDQTLYSEMYLCFWMWMCTCELFFNNFKLHIFSINCIITWFKYVICFQRFILVIFSSFSEYDMDSSCVISIAEVLMTLLQEPELNDSLRSMKAELLSIANIQVMNNILNSLT